MNAGTAELIRVSPPEAVFTPMQISCLKTCYGASFQPSVTCYDYFLGLRPRLIWMALSALGFQRWAFSAAPLALYNS